MWGGDNGTLSLTQARDNFRRCGAYDPRIGRELLGEAKPESKSDAPPDHDLAARRQRKLKHLRLKALTTPSARSPPGQEVGRERSYAELLESVPEEIPARPPPVPPRPPSVWARPISTEQFIQWVAGGLIMLLIAAGIQCYTSGSLTPAMLKDHAYYRWAHGVGRYEPKYVAVFARDPRLRHRFIGQPVDSLHRLFPKVHGGPPYDPARFRALNGGREFPSSVRGGWLGVYWLGQPQPSATNTYCVLVRDGKIADFLFADARPR
jgi:hypothetical protein